jgi:predicted RNA binding protein YcfA (HicA-like mRNA interferase family)
MKFSRPDRSRRIIVPMHTRDVPPGTLRGILRSAGIDDERFLELLRQ